MFMDSAYTTGYFPSASSMSKRSGSCTHTAINSVDFSFNFIFLQPSPRSSRAFGGEGKDGRLKSELGVSSQWNGSYSQVSREATSDITLRAI